MVYNSPRYIYPPRPKNAIPPSELGFYDNGSMIGQVKSNGSNCVIITNGDQYTIMNRHNQYLTNFKLGEEIKSLYRGNGEWMIINGEYLNKNKSDETGSPFNHKLVIFDILVYQNIYLVGRTVEERINLLYELYGQVESEKEYLYKVSENIYMVKSYGDNFENLFNELTPIDLIEGFVIKRKNAKLENSGSELNNQKWQIKCRKPTKNYKY